MPTQHHRFPLFLHCRSFLNGVLLHYRYDCYSLIPFISVHFSQDQYWLWSLFWGLYDEFCGLLGLRLHSRLELWDIPCELPTLVLFAWSWPNSWIINKTIVNSSHLWPWNIQCLTKTQGTLSVCHLFLYIHLNKHAHPNTLIISPFAESKAHYSSNHVTLLKLQMHMYVYVHT